MRCLGVRTRRGGIVRPLLVAAVSAGVATSLAAVPGGISTASAALVYVLAVTGATAFAGLRAGLATSILSFLPLNFFFTEPTGTFSVAKTEDLVALAAFLIVSVIVGTLLSAAVAQRARAERREREAVLMQRLGARLLSGEPPQGVLASFARAVTDLFGIVRCEIRTDVTDEPVVSERPAAAAGVPEVMPMEAAGRKVGEIVLVHDAEADGLSDDERNVVRTFASQMALALEGMRLASEASKARLDAETNSLRAALFSSVTHDLRTPLASITASVTSLLDEGARFTPGDRRELLETIRHEAERLNRLVGNLLDLSRIRAGAVTPNATLGEIEDVIEGVVGRLQAVLANHRIHLMLRGDLPEISMDVVQIDQVLTNLIENAVKFSPAGSAVTISAARWHDTAEVRVVDHGPGIPSEERERVFEAFVRGEQGSATGSGLGLSISRAIVESHGGRIWIEGTPGGGTTVVFRLPVAAR
ncbi:MAG TPA: ATP-binding protein [Actinomycetota bacterium]|jgi:two-component system sensor histidine kinase KdpD|nr:ATP-binding protein [Actinomycetota bacterium]